MTETSNEMMRPEQLSLYFSPYCPYCHRVLNAMQSMGLSPDLAVADAGGIALLDTVADRDAAQALRNGGGKSTVPCLRIDRNGEIEWLYESLDIIDFLQTQLTQA